MVTSRRPARQEGTHESDDYAPLCVLYAGSFSLDAGRITGS